MPKFMGPWTRVIAAGTLAFSGMAGPALAQAVSTNLPGVTAYLGPPANFNPLIASDAELEKNHLPPRPDGQQALGAYSNWAKAMTSGAQAVIPVLERTNVYHRPAKIVGTAVQTENSTAINSNNWSGAVLLGDGSNKPFTIEAIQFLSIVPMAQQAFGACTGSYDYGSAWVGIDGWSSSDVFQAGYEFDADCSDATKTPFYSAWYEWFPNGSVRIANFPISPGDVIFTEIHNTSATQGSAYIQNETANKSVTISFKAPSGTKLTGDSAEWIVERPGISTGLATLTNYVVEPFTSATTWNYKAKTPTYRYPGSATTGTVTTLAVTMLDNNKKPISYAVIGGLEDMWFYDEGSAR